MKWDGTSTCDLMIRAYKHYNFTALRPFERIEIIKCVEQRMLAVQLGRKLGVNLPHDLVYNWKRKYAMMYQLFKSGIIYLRYTANDIDKKDMFQQMKQMSIDTEIYIPFWNKVRLYLRQFTVLSHFDSFIHKVFYSFDNNIEKSDTGWGNIYRIYKHGSKAVKAIYNHTKSTDLHYEFAQTDSFLLN